MKPAIDVAVGTPVIGAGGVVDPTIGKEGRRESTTVALGESSTQGPCESRLRRGIEGRLPRLAKMGHVLALLPRHTTHGRILCFQRGSPHRFDDPHRASGM
jgi:hypothetical protein